MAVLKQGPRPEEDFAIIPNDVVLGIKNGNALLVYSILLTLRAQDGRAYPTRETIAEHMGAKTVKPVDQALKYLANLGLVATFPRWRNEDHTSIAHRRDEKHRYQTSNGYTLYGHIQQEDNH